VPHDLRVMVVTSALLVMCSPRQTKVVPRDDTDSSSDTDDKIDTDTDTAVEDTQTPIDTGPCANFQGQATPAEIAATPRADTNLEALARSMGTTLVADQVVYDRVVQDVGNIRSQYPDMSSITYFEADDGQVLLIGADSATFANMESGKYPAWDCPNALYEMTSFSVHSFYAQLTFEGSYEMELLGSEYSLLPGVDYAEPNRRVGDGPTICSTEDGPTYHYVFDNAYGDCFSGCIYHDFSYFTTDSQGMVTFHGKWSNSMSVTPPSWVQQYGQC